VCADVREDPKEHNRVLQLLNKQALAGIVESSKTSGGSEGSYRSHALLSDPEMVHQALVQSTPALAELMSVDRDSEFSEFTE
jgi:Cdc6-like AAA superfamily ATPase